MSKPFTLKQIKGHLQKLNDRWNVNYWIFVAGGEVHLMKKSRNGQRMVESTGGVDPKGIVSDYSNIKADGGDW